LRGRDRWLEDESLFVSKDLEPAREEFHPLYGRKRSEEVSQVNLSRRAADRFLDALNRDCSPAGKVLAVLHGEVILAIRRRLEGWSREEFQGILSSLDPHYRLPNGSLVQYSRTDPGNGFEQEASAENQGQEKFSKILEGTYHWVRTVCPWDFSNGDGKWKYFARKKFSNQELMARAKTSLKVNTPPPQS